MRRKGLGRGLGTGYYNLAPMDSYVHSLSAKGMKTISIRNNNLQFVRENNINLSRFAKDIIKKIDPIRDLDITTSKTGISLPDEEIKLLEEIQSKNPNFQLSSYINMKLYQMQVNRDLIEEYSRESYINLKKKKDKRDKFAKEYYSREDIKEKRKQQAKKRLKKKVLIDDKWLKKQLSAKGSK